MASTDNANGITLSVCSIAFRDEPIEELIPRFAEIGFDAIEVFGKQVLDRTDEELDLIRDTAAKADIGLLAIAPYFVLTRGQEEFDETMQTAEKSVHAAQKLGATKIRTFTDVANTGIGTDIAEPHHWEQAVRGLKQITAMDRNIQFVVETHGHTLADTVESCEQLIERVGEANLKLNYQANGDFFDHGLHASFDRLLPHIAHMHVHQAGREHGDGWIEEPGRIDFPSFIDHVISTGYSESISLEYCWKPVSWERVKTGHDYLRSLLAKKPAAAR